MPITIIEGLHEMKTMHERIAKKRAYINQHLCSHPSVREPQEQEGGWEAEIVRQFAVIVAMQDRVFALRRAITAADLQTLLQIGERRMSIHEWLVWKREIAPYEAEHYEEITRILSHARAPTGPGGVVINVHEAALGDAADKLRRDLGALEGLLLVHNATAMVDVDAVPVF